MGASHLLESEAPAKLRIFVIKAKNMKKLIFLKDIDYELIWFSIISQF